VAAGFVSAAYLGDVAEAVDLSPDLDFVEVVLGEAADPA
jgi:hypothetical protein